MIRKVKNSNRFLLQGKEILMNTDRNKEHRQVKFEVKRVYVGKKPIEEVFENVIEHIVDKNIEVDNKRKQTQA